MWKSSDAVAFKQLLHNANVRCHSSRMPVGCLVKSAIFVIFQGTKILFEEILFEIGFIEEMRTIGGNKEVPPNHVPLFPLFAKIDLKIRLTPYNWQPCVSKFRDVTRA